MTTIPTLLTTEQKKFNARIVEILNQYKTNLSSIGELTEDTLTRLQESSLRGKGIRGALLLFSARANGSQNEKTIIDIAAGIEILHSSLLIHDDIMDNDMLRRGKPSIYAQYISKGENIQSSDSLHFARSMGICVGDVGFFIGLDICTKVLFGIPNGILTLQKLIQEFSIVSLAQMSDVSFSHAKKMPSTEEIMKVYTYKTARYTFSLPLYLGAALAGKDNNIQKLDKLGEHIGIIFQIIDDEIGIFSTEEELGKPVGSDIRENKKTLLRALLEKHLSAEEKQELENSDDDQILETLKTYIQKYHIDTELKQIIKDHQTEATHIIDSLEIDNSDKETLHNLIEFVIHRRS